MPDFNPRRQQIPESLFRDRMVDGTPGPEMIALSGGEYLRGDSSGDGDNDEKPPRPVKPGPFAIGTFEVTFEEYDQFCDATGHPRPDDEGWGRGRRPVINVSWQDAKAFTDWLSSKTRQIYRLPSDAEWEYAARAGTRSRFWWGNEPGTARANCEGCGSLWDGEKTARVGKFRANPYGLHDTAGNVFEWVADCYHDSFANAPIDGSALDKPGCGKRVIRGGAWSFPPREIRSANRWRDFPSRHSDDTGFRIVRELTELSN
jgi:formylglycine-generating enzyme required for sulfatase activity